jgi:hypothetical protein
MAGWFEITTATDGQFMFNLKAGNGEVILTSERYKAKDSALNGIESVRKNATDGANFERRTSSAGEPYFVLKAANGQEIGRSEMYSGNAAMENGIASVQRNAPDAEIRDKSG